MKLLLSALVFLILLSCSTELVGSWKNPEISNYHPSKVLIIGMTTNTVARQQFENQLKKKFKSRGSDAVTSLEFFDLSMLNEMFTEKRMEELEKDLISEGFDTVLFTKVIGVDNKIRYKENYDGFDETYKKFKEEYLMYQDIYYNPEYYEDYDLYHTETSMYCICPSEDRQLIWKGYIDIADPQNVDEIVNDYVELVIFTLEANHLIAPLNQEVTSNDDILL